MKNSSWFSTFFSVIIRQSEEILKQFLIQIPNRQANLSVDSRKSDYCIGSTASDVQNNSGITKRQMLWWLSNNDEQSILYHLCHELDKIASYLVAFLQGLNQFCRDSLHQMPRFVRTMALVWCNPTEVPIRYPVWSLQQTAHSVVQSRGNTIPFVSIFGIRSGYLAFAQSLPGCFIGQLS